MCLSDCPSILMINSTSNSMLPMEVFLELDHSFRWPRPDLKIVQVYQNQYSGLLQFTEDINYSPLPFLSSWYLQCFVDFLSMLVLLWLWNPYEWFNRNEISHPQWVFLGDLQTQHESHNYRNIIRTW